MCRPLLHYLNGKFHARHSVKHINETDYAATVVPQFVLTDVVASRDPYRGYLGHARDRKERRHRR